MVETPDFSFSQIYETEQMNKDDYQFIKATLITVDGLPLNEQIEQVKIKCKSHPHLIDSITAMLESEAEDIELENRHGKQGIFASGLFQSTLLMKM